MKLIKICLLIVLIFPSYSFAQNNIVRKYISNDINATVTLYIDTFKQEKSLNKRKILWGSEYYSRYKKEQNFISHMLVKVNGENVYLNYSSYSDLTNVRNLELKSFNNGFVIVIKGGFNPSIYKAKIYISKEGNLLKRKVFLTTFPDTVWEQTEYHFNDLDN